MQRDLKKRFQDLDLNEKDYISFDEWVVSYKVVGIDTKHARASFDVMDKNIDGQISMEE